MQRQLLDLDKRYNCTLTVLDLTELSELHESSIDYLLLRSYSEFCVLTLSTASAFSSLNSHGHAMGQCAVRRASAHESHAPLTSVTCVANSGLGPAT
eukprot:1083452-Prymnesium_polylepis.1